MDPITVVTLADETYAMPLAVMVRSLLDHLSAGQEIRVIVIDGGISPATKQRLEDSWRDSAGWPSCLVDYVRPIYIGERLLPAWGRIPVLTYARISAAEYVQAGCRRVILLDSDVLVLTDVASLAATELDGATIAATRDPFVPFVSSHSGLHDHCALGLGCDARYFNAGVMLIDVERWRAEDVAARAFAFVHRHWQTLHHYDQDSLNAVLAGRWKELDPRWQAQPRITNSLGGPPLNDPYLIHFSGLLKPWTYPARHLADTLFFDFVDRTDWSGARPPRTLLSRAISLYDSPIRRFCYPLEKRLMALWRRRARRPF